MFGILAASSGWFSNQELLPFWAKIFLPRKNSDSRKKSIKYFFKTLSAIKSLFISSVFCNFALFSGEIVSLLLISILRSCKENCQQALEILTF